MEDQKSEDSCFCDEYKLAIDVQMHFNDILMKFRSFSTTAVFLIYSYALSKPASSFLTVSFITVKASTLVAMGGVVLAVIFAMLDIFYFFGLLIGSVDRAIQIENKIPYRLTSTIGAKVPEKRAKCLLFFFYLIVCLIGIAIAILLSIAKQ